VVLWASLPAPAGGLDALATRAALRLMAPVVLGLPAGAWLLFTSLFGALRGPRRVVAPVVGVLAAVAVAGVVYASGRAIDEGVFAPSRAVAYALVGAFAAVGLAAGDRERGVGGECAAAAGVAFAALVLAGEGAGLAMPELVLAINLQSVAVEARPAFIDAFFAEAVTVALPWAWGAAAIAAVFVGASVSAGAPGPRRVAWAVVASLWLIPGVAMIAAAPTQSAWVAAAATVPAPPPAPPVQVTPG
jgi:hypothetical protein